MDDNWTRGVAENDLIGVGAGLAARELDALLYVITNAVHPDDPRLVRQYYFPPGEDRIEESEVVIIPGTRFPYGYRIGPP